MSEQTHLTGRPSLTLSRLPSLLLHLEGAAVLAAAFLLYRSFSFSWLAFGLLLFVPDLSMVGYGWNPRVGSLLYNLGHTYLWPLALAGVSMGVEWMPGVQLALIWLAHIGLDRLCGYGLKYPTQFKDTHLSRV